MGTDKAFVEIDGTPLVVRVADALNDAGAESVVVIGGDVIGLRAAGLVAIEDPRPAAGPVGGLVSALEITGEPDVVMVLACDLIAPAPVGIWRTVDALLEAPRAAAAVPMVQGRYQWLCGAWRSSLALEPIRQAFGAGARSFGACVHAVHIDAVEDLDPAWVQDADTPADLPEAAPLPPSPTGSRQRH